jgi:acetyl esterase/lipase
MVFIHGGGWSGGDKTGYGTTTIKPYLDAGISVAAVKYRFINQAMEQKVEPPVKACLHDAARAIQTIRSKAKEWNIDPAKVGMIGFSAGAMLTMSTTLYAADAKPAFIGNIYGPLNAVMAPNDAPPLFVALAADDPFFANAGFGLIESWKAAKRPVEFHLYEQGGHGFGMYNKETTSTGWFESFAAWLKMHGYIK